MMATNYPTVLDELEQACGDYRRRLLTLDALKAAVWKAASEVVAHDERELRTLLQCAEGRLDMIQFTTDDANVFGRTLEIIEEVEHALRRWR